MSANYDAQPDDLGTLNTSVDQPSMTPDQGAQSPDPRFGQALKMSLLNQPLPPPEIQQALRGVTATEDFVGASRQVAEREQAGKDAKPPINASIDLVTGRIKGDFSKEYYQRLVKADQFYTKALGAHAQEMARLQALQLQTTSHPILNALATVSGSLAQASNLPPIVQALGRASAALNPTPAQISQQLLQGYQAEAALAGQQAAHAGQMMNYESLAQRREDLTSHENDATAEKTIKDVVSRVYSSAIKNGTPIDADQVKAVLSTHPTIQALQKKGMQIDAPMIAKAVADLGGSMAQGSIDKENRQQEMAQERIRLKGDLAVKLADKQVDLYARKSAIIEARQKGIIDYSEAAAERGKLFSEDIAVDKQLGVIPVAQRTQLEKAKEVLDFMTDMEKLTKLPKFAEYVGPYNVQHVKQSRWFKGLESADQQFVETFFGHEFPRGVDLANAGVRGFSKAEQPVIDKLLARQWMTTDQIAIVSKVVKDRITERQRAIIAGTPKAPWEKLGYLLKDDAPDGYVSKQPDIMQYASTVRAGSGGDVRPRSAVGKKAAAPAAQAPAAKPEPGSVAPANIATHFETHNAKVGDTLPTKDGVYVKRKDGIFLQSRGQ